MPAEICAARAHKYWDVDPEATIDGGACLSGSRIQSRDLRQGIRYRDCLEHWEADRRPRM